MQQIAFLMRLKPGAQAEYRKRHEEIWPELIAALRAAGIRDYSIFLDEKTLNLFAVLKLAPEAALDGLEHEPVMRRWWDYMADLMLVDPTNKPVQTPLLRVFHMD